MAWVCSWVCAMVWESVCAMATALVWACERVLVPVRVLV